MRSHSRAASPLFVALVSGLFAACGPSPEPVTPAPTAKPSAAPVATASAAAAPDTAVHKTETLAADTSMKTASSATFLAPKGWHVTEMDGHLLLQEPEKEMRIV